MPIKYFIALLFTTYYASAFAQDTTVYRQKDAAMFSNNYRFFRKTPKQKRGNFVQIIHTDDCQVFAGAGVFKEKRTRLILHFSPRPFNVTEIKHSDSDSVHIYWQEYEFPAISYYVRYSDTIRYPEIYHCEPATGMISIANNNVHPDSMSLYNLNGIHIKSFLARPGDSIIIHKDWLAIQPIHTKKAVLRKRANALYGRTMWTKKKKGWFVKSTSKNKM